MTNFIAQVLGFAGLALLFVGFPIIAYQVVGHWLAPVIVVAWLYFRSMRQDWA